MKQRLFAVIFTCFIGSVLGPLLADPLTFEQVAQSHPHELQGQKVQIRGYISLDQGSWCLRAAPSSSCKSHGMNYPSIKVHPKDAQQFSALDLTKAVVLQGTLSIDAAIQGQEDAQGFSWLSFVNMEDPILVEDSKGHIYNAKTTAAICASIALCIGVVWWRTRLKKETD